MRFYTLNNGMGQEGTHCTSATTYVGSDISRAVANPRFIEDITPNEHIKKVYYEYATAPSRKKSIPIRAINKMWRILFGKNLIQ